MLSKTILIGRVGNDPDIRAVNGKDMATFSLATSERWKDKESGEKKEKTEWHRIVTFQERLVDVIKKYVKKGSKLYIEGQITSRKWTDKDGVERVNYEILLNFNGVLVLLDKKESNATPDSAYEGDR